MKQYTDYHIEPLIQKILPEAFRFSDDCRPSEEEFSWRNSTLHVDRMANPNATHKVILHHGVGTNGRLLSMILGVPLLQRGYEVVAIDMPLYGKSQNNEPTLSYEDWLDVSMKFIDSEIARDGKPVVLYGLSAGGMLAYHVACMEPRVKGVIGMCFLNLGDQSVTDMISPFPLPIERSSILSLKIANPTPLKHLKVPMKLVSKMKSLANDKAIVKELLRDKYSAGAWVPIKFLTSLFSYQTAIQPENFTNCPVLLTQPAQDNWTPLAASQSFFDRIAAPKSIIMLENAGHYPLESPGLEQMVNAIDNFITGLDSNAQGT